MTKTFPTNDIQRLRRYAAKASEAPEDCPNGWSKSTIDPMVVLAITTIHKLKTIMEPRLFGPQP